MAAHEAATWSSRASAVPLSQTCLHPSRRPASHGGLPCLPCTTRGPRRSPVLAADLLRARGGHNGCGWGRGGPGVLRAQGRRHSEPNRQAQAGVQTGTGSHPMAESVLRAKQHQQFSKQVITSTSTLQTQPSHMMGGGIYNEQCLCETACGGEKESEIISLWVNLFT